MKPFKTYRQQLAILRKRGLLISNGSKAMRILERENYYSLINGYKDLFLLRDSVENPLVPEQYKDQTRFEEIYSLFTFDRELRSILLETLLKFESSMKTKTSYRFTEKFKEPNTYLDMTNYSRDPMKLKNVLRVIATISNEISKKAEKRGPIKHYLDNHDGVPFWVLAGYLTMGNMQFFYESIDDSLRNKIACDFSVSYEQDYHVRIHFTDDELHNILKAATFFRNVCAHEERLFNFTIHRPPKSSSIASHLAITPSLLNKGNLFAMVSFLKLVTIKKDYKILLTKLDKLFSDYDSDFTSLSFSEILKVAGFPSDWREMLQ